MTHVKICGLRTVDDVEQTIAAGADAIGLNLVPGSPRQIDPATAQLLATRAAGRVLVVAVVVDPSPAHLAELLAEPRFDRIQLHGSETIAPHHPDRARLWKAVRLERPDQIAAVRALSVDTVLLDGGSGGAGARADWKLAAELAALRPIWLAGGLSPDNVALAIAAVKPFGVDVASGVERVRGIKDPGLVQAFVQAVKGQSS